MISLTQKPSNAVAAATVNSHLMEGLAVGKMIAVNPNAEEFQAFGLNVTTTPTYCYTKENGDRKILGLRLTFWIELISPEPVKGQKVQYSIFMERDTPKGPDGRLMVIDEFGRVGKLSSEELYQRVLPKGKDEAPCVSKNYRPAFIGEVKLTILLKNWLGIPFYKEGKTDPQDCQVRLDSLEKEQFWSGDVEELKKLIPLTQERQFQVLLVPEKGVDGVVRQGVYDVFPKYKMKQTIIDQCRGTAVKPGYWPQKYPAIKLETFDEAHFIQQPALAEVSAPAGTTTENINTLPF